MDVVIVGQNARVVALVTLVDVHDLQHALVVSNLEFVFAGVGAIQAHIVLFPVPFSVGVVARHQLANKLSEGAHGDRQLSRVVFDFASGQH